MKVCFLKRHGIGLEYSIWKHTITMSIEFFNYLASTLLRRSKNLISVYHFFFSFSGNGLLAGLSMKRPSVYIDQWTEENAQWHLLENIKEQSQFNCDSP